jgi:hypothetical protein
VCQGSDAVSAVAGRIVVVVIDGALTVDERLPEALGVTEFANGAVVIWRARRRVSLLLLLLLVALLPPWFGQALVDEGILEHAIEFSFVGICL